jgi:hypothetical protein
MARPHTFFYASVSQPLKEEPSKTSAVCVPNPANGSHLDTTVNPAFPTRGYSLLDIIQRARISRQHRNGTPTGFLPAVIRASLISVIILPTIGAAAEAK